MKERTINNIIQAWWNIQILVFLTLFILAPYRPFPLWCMICACCLLVVCVNLRLCHRLYGILSKIALVLYTISYVIVAFMFIEVASPKIWLAIVIAVVGLINVLCCIKLMVR